MKAFPDPLYVPLMDLSTMDSLYGSLIRLETTEFIAFGEMQSRAAMVAASGDGKYMTEFLKSCYDFLAPKSVGDDKQRLIRDMGKANRKKGKRRG